MYKPTKAVYKREQLPAGDKVIAIARPPSTAPRTGFTQAKALNRYRSLPLSPFQAMLIIKHQERI